MGNSTSVFLQDLKNEGCSYHADKLETGKLWLNHP